MVKKGAEREREGAWKKERNASAREFSAEEKREHDGKV